MRKSLPNLVSASRLGLVVPLAWLIWHSARHDGEWRGWAVFLFAWISASDVLDGYLARKLDAATELGRLLDPAADKLVALAGFVLLAMAGQDGFYHPVAGWIAAVVVLKDLWLTIGYLVVRLFEVPIRIQPSGWGKLSTSCQLALVAGVLIEVELSAVRLAWLVPLLLWMVVAATTLATVLYTWSIVRRLAAADLLAGQGPAGRIR